MTQQSGKYVQSAAVQCILFLIFFHVIHTDHRAKVTYILLMKLNLFSFKKTIVFHQEEIHCCLSKPKPVFCSIIKSTLIINIFL